MNKQIKARWIEALRSGDYKQGVGFLKHNNKYCCLGVLCELATEKNVCNKKELDSLSEYDGSLTHLPETVKEWLDIDDFLAINLMKLNDEGSTFREIADILEQE